MSFPYRGTPREKSTFSTCAAAEAIRRTSEQTRPTSVAQDPRQWADARSGSAMAPWCAGTFVSGVTLGRRAMMRIMLRAPSIVTRQSLGEHLVQKHWNPVKAVLGMEKSKGLRLST